MTVTRITGYATINVNTQRVMNSIEATTLAMNIIAEIEGHNNVHHYAAVIEANGGDDERSKGFHIHIFVVVKNQRRNDSFRRTMRRKVKSQVTSFTGQVAYLDRAVNIQTANTNSASGRNQYMYVIGMKDDIEKTILVDNVLDSDLSSRDVKCDNRETGIRLIKKAFERVVQNDYLPFMEYKDMCFDAMDNTDSLHVALTIMRALKEHTLRRPE